MKRIVGVTVAWTVVAAMMAIFAWQAVSAAGSRVNDQPLYPLSAGAPALPAADGDVVAQTGGTVEVPVETDLPNLEPANGGTSSTTPTEDSITPGSSSNNGAVTTTSAGGSSSSTSTTTGTTSSSTSTSTTAATTTTTSPTAELERASYVLTGGTITIEFGGGQVFLVSAVPKAGFATDIDSTGPTNVDVDFRSEGHRSKFDAEWQGGQLKVDIDEEPES